MIASEFPSENVSMNFVSSEAKTKPTLAPFMALARSAAETNCAILLTGESGVGKEVLADFIQAHSLRKSESYMKINCAALSEKLIETELFGYEQGAFSGAVRAHVGRLERALGGTVFLDEIGELSPAMQTKLLRVLQTKEIERVGGTETVSVEFRLICATHRSLEALLSDSNFNRDLFYRISTVPIRVPALRERREEIPALARTFVQRNRSKLRCAPEEIDDEAISLLRSHHWPGNIRELENCLECACLLGRDHCLHASDIWWMNANRPREAATEFSVPTENIPTEQTLTLLEQSELQTLRRTLEEYDWNYSHTAEALNVSRSTLYLKAGKYGLAGRRKHNRVHAEHRRELRIAQDAPEQFQTKGVGA